MDTPPPTATETKTPVPAAAIESIGVVAGQGQFPILLATAARDAGVKVIGFGLRGFAKEDFEACVDEMNWVELGQFNLFIEMLHQQSIAHIALVGRVPHNSIWQYRHFDARAVKLLASSLNLRADAIMTRVCDEFRREGIEVIDSTLFLRSLMPRAGQLTNGSGLTREQREDIEFALPIARSIAGLDIGQSIIVKDKAVIAVEGLEGTDACIRRGGELAGEGIVLVKVSKPRQDRRFDVPVVGPRTVESMEAVGGKVIAISAEETLVLGRDEMIERAEKAGIAVIAVENPPTTIDES